MSEEPAEGRLFWVLIAILAAALGTGSFVWAVEENHRLLGASITIVSAAGLLALAKEQIRKMLMRTDIATLAAVLTWLLFAYVIYEHYQTGHENCRFVIIFISILVLATAILTGVRLVQYRRAKQSAQNKLGFGMAEDYTDDQKVQITLPLHGQSLSDPQPLGPNSVSYVVRGKLKSLPEGHKIWLITADERAELYWPQTFYPVQFNKETGDWHGRVNPGRSPLQVFAVVAPPTSQDLFRYFQKRGDETKRFVPLNRIPPECRNVASVQTSFS
jgi:hypothetical protein